MPGYPVRMSMIMGRYQGPISAETETYSLFKQKPINRIHPLIKVIIDREAREIMHLVASVRLSVCLPTFDLRPSYFAWRSTLTLARLAM